MCPGAAHQGARHITARLSKVDQQAVRATQEESRHRAAHLTVTFGLKRFDLRREPPMLCCSSNTKRTRRPPVLLLGVGVAQ